MRADRIIKYILIADNGDSVEGMLDSIGTKEKPSAVHVENMKRTKTITNTRMRFIIHLRYSKKF